MTALSMCTRRNRILSNLSVATLAAISLCGSFAHPVYAVQAAPATQTTNDTETVLVPGDPNLTKGMANGAISFIAFMLEAPLTVEQRDKLYTSIVEDWKKKDPDTISLVKDFSTANAQLMQKTDAERVFLRKTGQPEFLKVLQENQNDEGAKWMLSIYNAAHKPIAPGNPPLTRQMTDAYAEIFFFTASEVIGKKFTPTNQAKDTFAKILASGYSKATAAERKNINQMPLTWAALRVAWPTFPEEEKKAIRDKWAKDISKMLPPSPKPKAVATTASPKTTANASKKQYSGGRMSTADYAARMSELNEMKAMNSAYASMSNSLRVNYYRTSNTIAAWGNNPTRYVNSYGNPY